VFKTNAKKETWKLKCAGTVVIEGKKQKYKELRSGTYVVSGETYTFTETEGSIDGSPSRYGMVLKGVKPATGFNSPEHSGTHLRSGLRALCLFQQRRQA
jgi:formylmethanofuran dehydrogenase subunit C